MPVCLFLENLNKVLISHYQNKIKFNLNISNYDIDQTLDLF